MNRAETIAEIEACRPPGYFDAARPLLRRYVDLHAEIADLNVRWWRTWRRKPLNFEHLHELTAALCSASEETFELAETLHLLPGSRGLPPPRLQ